MKVLIVYAHPEPKSFNGAMKDLAVSVLKEQGHEVKVSDLYSMKFKSAGDKEDFKERSDPKYLNYMLEQRNASQKGLFIKDIKDEQEKLKWAEFIIVQCPIWWFSVPSILKAYFDRVLATDFSWGFGSIYDKGLLRGKKAMMSITTGGPEEYYKKEGPHGATIHEILYPITHGVFYFCGIEVLEPFIAWSVFQAGDDGRKKYLEEYKKRLENIEDVKLLPNHTFLNA